MTCGRHVVSPQTRLGFHARTAGLWLVGIELLGIHDGWQPDAGAEVHAPAVDVECAVASVEADDVISLILNPDCSPEAVAVLFGRAHLKHQALHFSKKFAMHGTETVVLAVEAGSVDEDHAGKPNRTERVKFRERPGHTLNQVLVEIELFLRRMELYASEKVVILTGNESQSRIGLHALKIGFHHRAVASNGFGERTLLDDDAVDRLIRIGGCKDGSPCEKDHQEN